MLALFFYMLAALGSSVCLSLLLWQGRMESLQGACLIAVTTLATGWFGYKLKANGAFLRDRIRQSLVVFIAGAAMIYLVAAASLYFLQDQLLFMPPRGEFLTCPSAKDAGYRFIDEVVGGIRLRMLVRVDHRATSWTIVFHGNAETACKGYVSYGMGLERLSSNVALVEYPGYQDLSTSPSQDGLTQSSLSAYDWVQAHDPAKLPIFVFGRSLGTGIATYLASRRSVDGLILVSAYTSIADVAQGQYPLVPVQLLIRSSFPASEWATRVNAPVLMIHGDADRVVPLELGRRLSRGFKSLDRFLEIPGAGHSDIMDRDAAGFLGGVGRFMNAHRG
jgi:hypothetical protein